MSGWFSWLSPAPSSSPETPRDSSCPMHSENAQRVIGHVGQPGFDESQIDPRNMMPAAPNQTPQPGQQKPLPLRREKSSIPRADTSKGPNWEYPSEQMFFNALRRKGKGEDVIEEDVTSIVTVHNTMNERTWTKLLAWEDARSSSDEQPRLVSFRGRPDELSPKARMLTLLGLRPAPFDRHDWIVQRGGDEVRYVIDYYYLENKTGLDAIDLDVRPALDSFANLKVRLSQAISGSD